MSAIGCFVLALLGGVPQTAVLATEANRSTETQPPEPVPSWLAGTWEGEISGSRWPTFITVQPLSGQERPGTLLTLGQQIPLASPVDTGERILLPLVGPWDMPPRLAFDRSGPNAQGRLRGVWEEGDRSFSLMLQRVPDYPEPAHRSHAWVQDISALRERFLRYDRSFGDDERAQFLAALQRLEHRVEEASDDEIILGISSAIALAGNAHTRLFLLRNRQVLNRMPLRAWWFDNELRIVAVREEHTRLLGCRIASISGIATAQVAAAIQVAFAGNDSWHRYKSPYFLTSIQALHGLGLADTPINAVLTLDDCAVEGDIALAPDTRLLATGSEENWHYLSPGTENWQHVLHGEQAPEYLRYPTKHYWFSRDISAGTLYLQINRSEPMAEVSIADTLADLLQSLETSQTERLIVDVRFNTGGNAQAFEDFTLRLERATRGLQRFLITGPATFSAGITMAARWRQRGDVRIVGEAVGDELRSWSEGGNIVLPNSGLVAHFANGSHVYDSGPCPGDNHCLQIPIETLEPDIVAALTWEDYLDGRDPAVDAILTAPRKAPRNRQ